MLVAVVAVVVVVAVVAVHFAIVFCYGGGAELETAGLVVCLFV